MDGIAEEHWVVCGYANMMVQTLVLFQGHRTLIITKDLPISFLPSSFGWLCRSSGVGGGENKVALSRHRQSVLQ